MSRKNMETGPFHNVPYSYAHIIRARHTDSAMSGNCSNSKGVALKEVHVKRVYVRSNELGLLLFHLLLISDV